jgi:hypothetical protein
VVAADRARFHVWLLPDQDIHQQMTKGRRIKYDQGLVTIWGIAGEFAQALSQKSDQGQSLERRKKEAFLCLQERAATYCPA